MHVAATSDVFCHCIAEVASSRHRVSEQFRGRRHLHLNQQTQHERKSVMGMPQESPGSWSRYFCVAAIATLMQGLRSVHS